MLSEVRVSELTLIFHSPLIVTDRLDLKRKEREREGGTSLSVGNIHSIQHAHCVYRDGRRQPFRFIPTNKGSKSIETEAYILKIF